MSVVLVDQDGVLANFEQGLLDEFRARHPGAPFIPVADRREFYARKQYPPEWAEDIGAIVGAEGFYRDLPAIEGSVAAMGEMLKAGHEVFLCTAPMISSRWCVQEKLAWVEHHLGRDWLRRTIIASDKTLIGDRFQPCVLIDDRGPPLPARQSRRGPMCSSTPRTTRGDPDPGCPHGPIGAR